MTHLSETQSRSPFVRPIASKAAMALSSVIFILSAPAMAEATDPQKPVVTPEMAKAIQVDPVLQKADLNIDGEDIRALPGLDLSSDIQTPAQDFADQTRPVIVLDRQDNTDFTIGAMPAGMMRDPYSVENINPSAMYPEGTYVDTMQAASGIDLKTKF